MPSSSSKGLENFWYSYDYGLVSARLPLTRGLGLSEELTFLSPIGPLHFTHR